VYNWYAVFGGTVLQAGRLQVWFLMRPMKFFHWFNSSDHTMVLGSTQPLTEMSTRHISRGGKGSWCVGLTILPPSSADCLEILGASTSWSHKGLICRITYSLTYKMGHNSSTVRQLLLAWKQLHRRVLLSKWHQWTHFSNLFKLLNGHIPSAPTGICHTLGECSLHQITLL